LSVPVNKVDALQSRPNARLITVGATSARMPAPSAAQGWRRTSPRWISRSATPRSRPYATPFLPPPPPACAIRSFGGASS